MAGFEMSRHYETRLIIVNYVPMIHRGRKKYKDLAGYCSPHLRWGQDPRPISEVQIVGSLPKWDLFETLLHELFHWSSGEVFGNQGDEKFVKPEIAKLVSRYKKHRLKHLLRRRRKNEKTKGRKR